MRPRSERVLVMALFGAVVGGLCLVVAIRVHPGIAFEMDRQLPPFITGIYPPERDQDLTFAWTAGRARMAFTGLDRRVDWTCVVRFRGGRAVPNPQPAVGVVVDGVNVGTRTATNEYQDFDVVVPRRPDKNGLAMNVESSITQVAGNTDRRQLGIQIDRVSCAPSGGVWPPRGALASAGLAGAGFAVLFALVGFPLSQALLATSIVAAAAAVPLTHPAALYGRDTSQAAWLGLPIAGSAALLLLVVQRWRREAIHPATGFVVAFSAGVLFLKLVALLHPDKALVDAVFHAHRLEGVLAGRFYFTQPMPDGVQFPYAIALYVVAAPWTALTTDHVALLRIVVAASEAIAGALLYWMVARVWRDRSTGALAVVLFHVVPLPYWVVGNANLTNAFGQSAALAALAGATLLPLKSLRAWPLAALIVLTAVAFLSHVSTFGLLAVTLIAAGGFYGLTGDRELRSVARTIAVATVTAAALSVVLYYGHFPEVYTGLVKVVATNNVATGSGEPTPSSGGPVARPTESRATAVPLMTRAAKAVSITLHDLGWPLLLLATAGAWRIGKEGARDRLAGVLAGWAAAYVLFTAIGALAPVGARFERYAAEFIGRVDFATYPAVAILAARGAVWGWRATPALRVISVALVSITIGLGAQEWVRWVA